MSTHVLYLFQLDRTFGHLKNINFNCKKDFTGAPQKEFNGALVNQLIRAHITALAIASIFYKIKRSLTGHPKGLYRGTSTKCTQTLMTETQAHPSRV